MSAELAGEVESRAANVKFNREIDLIWHGKRWLRNEALSRESRPRISAAKMLLKPVRYYSLKIFQRIF